MSTTTCTGSRRSSIDGRRACETASTWRLSSTPRAPTRARTPTSTTAWRRSGRAGTGCAATGTSARKRRERAGARRAGGRAFGRRRGRRRDLRRRRRDVLGVPAAARASDPESSDARQRARRPRRRRVVLRGCGHVVRRHGPATARLAQPRARRARLPPSRRLDEVLAGRLAGSAGRIRPRDHGRRANRRTGVRGRAHGGVRRRAAGPGRVDAGSGAPRVALLSRTRRTRAGCGRGALRRRRRRLAGRRRDAPLVPPPRRAERAPGHTGQPRARAVGPHADGRDGRAGRRAAPRVVPQHPAGRVPRGVRPRKLALPALIRRLGPLREREFRLLFAGQLVSRLGSAIAPVALAFAVLDLTGSASDLGIVLAARQIPTILFLLVGGVWADRLPRHRVMVVSNLVSGLSQVL